CCIHSLSLHDALPISVYFDGGFDGNTRTSGLGCVIYFEQNDKSWRQRKNALVEELETNNEAEYAALHLAVQEMELIGVHHLPVRSEEHTSELQSRFDL